MGSMTLNERFKGYHYAIMAAAAAATQTKTSRSGEMARVIVLEGDKKKSEGKRYMRKTRQLQRPLENWRSENQRRAADRKTAASDHGWIYAAIRPAVQVEKIFDTGRGKRDKDFPSKNKTLI